MNILRSLRNIGPGDIKSVSTVSPAKSHSYELHDAEVVKNEESTMKRKGRGSSRFWCRVLRSERTLRRMKTKGSGTMAKIVKRITAKCIELGPQEIP